MAEAQPADDCFALPPGTRWTPVDEALGVLQQRMTPVVGVEERSLAEAMGRIAAESLVSRWDVPAATNAAVDGYAYASDACAGQGSCTLNLVAGRAAAGHAFAGAVPAGAALRILTGAPMPAGADTVVLQEQVEVAGDSVVVRRCPRPGANVRKAGEDLRAGAPVVGAGRRLRPQDLAQAASAGFGRVPVYRPLTVGILSTGDEIREPAEAGDAGRVADANRPMLGALAGATGLQVRDLGIVPDQEAAVRAALDGAADGCDALVVTGGASGGDEDYVSRLLKAEGRMHVWRLAVKPGRPLVMARWKGLPVFGLPGNPVAVFVCFLIVARPALLRLAGAEWSTPRRYPLPLAAALRKKPGRREYLRARLTAAGTVERFHSEGSGLISGLRWSSGLIELAEDVVERDAGDPVPFIPYAEFGLVS